MIKNISFRQYYLFFLGGYVCTVFNENISRVVDFIALGLVIFGLFLIRKENFDTFILVIKSSKKLFLLFISLIALSILFLLSTMIHNFNLNGLISFLAQYGVHCALLVTSVLIVSINFLNLDLFWKSFICSEIIYVLYDLLIYLTEIMNISIDSIQYHHRWFGDGFVFLTPFLLLRIDIENNQKFRLALLFLLITVILLAGGTGSRSTYLILSAQIGVFTACTLYKKKLRLKVTLALSLLSLVCLTVLLSIVDQAMFFEAIKRAFRVQDRIQYAWIPGESLISQSPWFGYGFGSQSWDNAYYQYMSKIGRLESGTPFIGSTHSWFLNAGYFGGIFAMIIQFILSACIFLLSIENITNKESKSSALAIAIMVSFISFYILRGLVEFTTYKYLFLLAYGVIFIKILNFNNQRNIYKNGFSAQ